MVRSEWWLAGLIFPFKAATHCSELPYLFGKGIIALFRPSETDNKVVDFFTTLFTNFAKYGGGSDPVAKNVPFCIREVSKMWENASLPK
uniref:COesterase domain-containing protein n=1 Tax=Bursaphelenchus xylophilus TaxID=6326 RepID=A0A1I7S2G1_BURXY